MLQTIILVSPIFVTLFWSIVLTGNKKHSTLQLFLSKFMLLSAVSFIALFMYFEPSHEFYPYIDFILQYAASLALPVYYIYFRLLTVDNKFSFKAHSRYLAIPILIATTYCIGAILTPRVEFKTWLFDEYAFPDSFSIQFLNVMRSVLKIHFLLQLVITIIGNQLLIHKYGIKTEQFYSDMEDENYNNAKMLNFCIIIFSVFSISVLALDFEFVMSKETMLTIMWPILSIIFFYIGYMGIKQKSINPTFDLDINEDEPNQLEVLHIGSQKKILNKMLVQFEVEKIYLNSQLNIMDIVEAVGTNRTYISSIINQQYNQNFCSFVNSYRIVELERVILENPDYTNEILAECCGFGSLNSLKRAVFSKTGMSIPEWKKQTLV